jgi:DNA polymerase elongation subunit (family B)
MRKKLSGDLKYDWLVTTDSWKGLIALRNGLKNAGRNFFALSDPVQHYLTHTGRTLFKQLRFEELKRMQIEVLSFAGGDLEAAADDHITSIAVSDNTGWEELIEVDPRAIDESEHTAIKRLTQPDQGTGPGRDRGHNLFKFDLPFLVARARKAKTKLDWGEAAVSSVRARHGSRSRRRRSIIRSSRSRAGILSTPFCSRNFTTSGCVRFPASNEAMLRNTLA